MDNEDGVKSKLNDVWRTVNKIRAVIFKIGINLWDYFEPLDPTNNTLISESKFINIFGHQLKSTIGLSDEEINELIDYFRVQDGRIAYVQLCNVIDTKNSSNSDSVTGLQCEDSLHKNNRLSQHEHRRLDVLLMKIAHSVRLRELVLRSYFQDYELVAKNTGTITLAHFSRVLHFVDLLLSEDDFLLLVKRFIKDSYTVNYIGFVEEIERIVQCLDKFRMDDYSEDIKTNFPGRLIDAQLPKLPRPEIGSINIGKVFGKETSFHPVLKNFKIPKTVNEIVLRIQRYVHENRIRVKEFFQDFDLLRSGYVSHAQFIRGLDALGVSGLRRFYLSENEVSDLCNMYAEENDVSRIKWKSFETDIDEVFTIRCLDKKPYEIVESPPQEVVDVPKEGQLNWQEQSNSQRDLCEEALFKVRARIQKRRLYLEPSFDDFDRLNLGHVTRSQMRRVLRTNGILLSDEEIYALELRYNSDMGFNYKWFLDEADPKEYEIPKLEELKEKIDLINAAKIPKQPADHEKDIVQVLAHVIKIVVRNRIRIVDFMNGYDRHREMCIIEENFRRGLNAAGIFINLSEIDLLCDVFKSPLRNGYVDYKRFCDIVEEAFYQPSFDREPIIVPLQHFSSDDGAINFLNFEQRIIVSNALESLSKHRDQISNLSSLFEDFDRCKCGTINQNQFLRALTTRGLNNLISSREFELVCKCYGIERGLRLEVDYRSFLRALDLVAGTKIHYPF